MKKIYEVIIDRSSNVYEVEAENEQEANDLAMKEFQDNEDYTDYDYWIAETNIKNGTKNNRN